MTEEVEICKKGGHGMFFPLTQAEHDLPNGFRAAMYLLALLYLFLGVNIIADKFVAGIEVITSQKKRVRQKSTGRVVTVAVWNGTVANLTLMALGSSAPEILLSVIETVGGGFHSGDLGPGVIVGSAAFNLFVIIAVCIYAIPSPETRSIKEYSVFIVTGAFSMVAYFWLVVICSVSSPDVIDIWEAIATLLLFPGLIFLSYLADIGYFSAGKPPQIAKSHQQAIRLEDDLSAPVSGTGRHYGFGSRSDSRLGGEEQNLHGILTFPASTWEVGAGFEEREAHVPVLRLDGLEGDVSCNYRMEGRSAVPGYDFEASEGTLDFLDGESRNFITVKLLPKRLGEHSDQFQIILENAAGGAIFHPEGDGGRETSRLTITIRNENEDLSNLSLAMRVSMWLDGKVNMDAMRFAARTWKEEIRASVMEVVDDDDDDDDDGSMNGPPASPSAWDYFFHAITIPWKVPFAFLVPPSSLGSGWPCFLMSLVFIGGLTCWVIDFAELFGCCASVPNEITAITLVALGTSMPDLFASKTAACQDEHADASIVNVTGSNSVNVFLGIGVPWAMSAIYWKMAGATQEWKEMYPSFVEKYPEGAFVVKSGDLAFSVIVFSLAAFVALALIRARRTMLGGELGGAYFSKVISALFMVSLWFFYVGLSVWKILAGDVSVGSQFFAIFIAVCSLENAMLLLGIVAFIFRGRSSAAAKGKDLEAGDYASINQESRPAHMAGFSTPPVLEDLPPQSALRQSGRVLGRPEGEGFQSCHMQHPGASARPHFGGHGGSSPSPFASQRRFPTVYGNSMQSRFADPVGVMSFTNAAMVCLAVKRFRAQALGRDPASMSTPLVRENSFHSLDSSGLDASSSVASRQPQGIAGRVASYVSRNAVDWAALSAAGLVAAQVVDMQSGGTLLGGGAAM